MTLLEKLIAEDKVEFTDEDLNRDPAEIICKKMICLECPYRGHNECVQELKANLFKEVE
ncbi:MAG: hypothetical protein HUK23_03800 [Sphaerochaetaceae bacterium]|nr:hypothetical protein [Sphaerochaetaceae bacterium]